MRRHVTVCLVLILTYAVGADDSSMAARVGGEPVSLAEVDREAGARLMALRSQEYTLRRQALERVVAARLLEREATRRGVSLADLERAELDGKVAPPPPEAVDAALQKEASRMKEGSPPARAAIEARLLQQARMQRRAAFVAELQAQAKLEVMLEPPRVAVGADDDPALGPSEAPVTLIAFSDFQCPYCARVEPTLVQLRARYPTQLRIVFRDFPLAMHKEALKAAEAAGCADEQGKFWPMHERLFANPKALGSDDLKRHAAALGLDSAGFAACLDSGRRAAEVHADLRAGAEAGVTGTPAFFVNGRFLNGALPLAAFVDVIEDELRRARTAPTVSPLQP
ncbi:MAG: thioredoxin domain-containing protein [Vicinamibacteria bacterium]|nr:thioredoxin domain-containing protein [Vicinamibacteria bacterium]